MCDYSLELYRAVPAAAGEQYTLARFASGSMGFTSGKTCDTAVCVPADAHLRLEGISETLQRALNVGPIAEVVMTRLDTGPHKDAVRDGGSRPDQGYRGAPHGPRPDRRVARDHDLIHTAPPEFLRAADRGVLTRAGHGAIFVSDDSARSIRSAARRAHPGQVPGMRQAG